MIQIPIDDLGDFLKISLIATFVGIIPTLLFAAISPMLGQFQFVIWLVYGLLAIMAIPWLPKESDTFAEFLAVFFLILALQGVLGLVLPFQQLQWAGIASSTGLLTALGVAIFSVGLGNKIMGNV